MPLRRSVTRKLSFLVVAIFLSTLILFHKSPGLGDSNRHELVTAKYSYNQVRKDFKIRTPTGGCVPLQTNISSGNKNKIGGVYMQTLDTPRNYAKFPILPDIAVEVPSECNTKHDDILFTMVNVVKSAITNQERRNSIRATWGAVRVNNDVRIETVFVVGLTQDRNVQADLIEESNQYGDILQFDELDSAAIVPLKVLAGMEWASTYLPPSWLYSSVDDDIIVHLPNLVDYIYSLFRKIAPSAKSVADVCTEQLPLVCVYSYQARDVPARNKQSKWYMPPEKFPGETWPVYCRGGMYTMPIKMVASLYEVSRTTEHLYLDDVWITGFMRRKLGKFDSNIMPAPHSVRKDEDFYKFDDFKDILMQHVWGNIKDIKVNVPEAIVNIWQKWKNSVRKGCTIDPVNRLAAYIEKQRGLI